MKLLLLALFCFPLSVFAAESPETVKGAAMLTRADAALLKTQDYCFSAYKDEKEQQNCILNAKNLIENKVIRDISEIIDAQ